LGWLSSETRSRWFLLGWKTVLWAALYLDTLDLIDTKW
jgi:DNA-binding IclR family transcriptional regulator